MKTTNDKDSLLKTLLFSLFALTPFLVISVMGIFESHLLKSFDTRLGLFFYSRGSDFLTQLMIALTKLGNPLSVFVIVLIISLLILVIKRDWKNSLWYALTVLIGAAGLNSLVKTLFHRVRPEFTHLIEQEGYSFPSGHAMGAVIYFGAFAYLIYYFTPNKTQTKSRKLKAILLTTTIIFSLIMGYTRLYLGVHFPSDILGGFSLGSAFLMIAIYCHQRWVSVTAS